MTFEIGTAVGSYTIEDKLGQGGMATVYKAYHDRLDRHVAIKVMHAVFKDNDQFLRRFSREAKVVANLEHAHIVPVYDFADHDGYPYLVMRFIDGETLKDRLDSGTLGRTEILRIAQALAEALDYAHTHGVLHRDIKPSNILLTQGGGVYITDFGLARIAQAGESTLSQGMIMGTPQYISPEQAKGNVELDGRADVYSFGIMLYEMVAGRVPFQSDTSYSIIHSQIFEPPPLPSTLNDKITPAVEEVLLKVLSKEPDDRHETAGELVNAFSDALNRMPSDMAPRGAAVLPDYTPAGLTRPIAPEDAPALTDLSDAPSSEETAVSPPPTQRRPAILIGAGILLGMFICFGLGFLLLNARNNNAQDTPLTDTTTQIDAVADTSDNEPDDLPPTVEDPPPQPVDDNSPPTKEGPTPEQPPEGAPERPILDNVNIPDIGSLLTKQIRPVDELEKMHEEHPENESITLELAAAYMKEGQPDKARDIVHDTFDRVRKPVGFSVVGEQLLEQQQYEMAELILEEGLMRFQTDTSLKQLLMMAYLFNGKSGTEIENYLESLKNKPHNPTTVHIGNAYIAFTKDDPALALSIGEEALEKPNVQFAADMLYVMGRFNVELDQPDAALELFSTALEYEVAPWLATHIEAEIVQLDQS
ncbi:MAG: hypothetical protein DWQ04_03725 [Chloroflexi bacterium]|nr:MAG: hypothetical protein DWQ04_03725 [Chloroflexota bacterium]